MSNKPAVTIASHYISQFGELWDKSLPDLIKEAMEQVIARADQAKLAPENIEAVFIANKAGGSFTGQRHLNALASSFLSHQPPAIRVEGACASGGLAVMAAVDALLSGRYETVLVVGAEKMSDLSASETTEILASAADMEAEYGSTFPALYALLADAHMREFGTTREQLSAVAVKNHRQAMTNPQAQYHREFTLDQVSTSTPVADPLRLLDCSPITDGAAAIILTTKKIPHKPIIIGRGHAQDSLDLAGRSSLTTLAATVKAAQQAYTEAGAKPSELEAAEVHDCFTIAEILAIEDLGFVEKGQGGVATLAGDLPVKINLSGGLKACGHPVGATGVKQVAYMAGLIESGQYQLGLTHNVGGSGATAVVHIIAAPDRKPRSSRSPKGTR